MPRLLVVDGHGYGYRAFYAIRQLRSPSGQGVNGIFGFVKMLAKLRVMLAPSHVVVVWDGGLDAERVRVLPGYKAHRPEMPAELGAQIDGMVDFLEASGVASVCREGVEADDWMGCVARAGAQAGWEVVVASADKDFMQLVTKDVGEGKAGELRVNELASAAASSLTQNSVTRTCSPGWVGLWNPNDKSERLWGAADVRSKTGVEPSQVLDWLSLVGDAVDGIPGVLGVGPKTASGLLNLFGSVDGIYARLAEVKSERVREALRASEAVVRRNQGLVALKMLPGFEFVPGELAPKSVEVERLAGLYRGWGFKGLLAELEGMRQGDLI